jgi:hypothetical protein
MTTAADRYIHCNSDWFLLIQFGQLLYSTGKGKLLYSTGKGKSVPLQARGAQRVPGS